MRKQKQFRRTTKGLRPIFSLADLYIARSPDGRLPTDPGRPPSRGPVTDPGQAGEYVVEQLLNFAPLLLERLGAAPQPQDVVDSEWTTWWTPWWTRSTWWSSPSTARRPAAGPTTWCGGRAAPRRPTRGGRPSAPQTAQRAPLRVRRAAPRTGARVPTHRRAAGSPATVDVRTQEATQVLAVRLYRTRAAGSPADHAALRAQEAQAVTGDPIPARADAELRPEVQRGHRDHLARRLGRAEGRVDDHRRRRQAGGVGRRQADGHGAWRRRDGEAEEAG